MKILQVGKFYYPSPGGIETLLRNLSEGLHRLGEEVTVLCASSGKQKVEETLGGVRVIRIPCYGTAFSQPITPALTPALRRLAPEFDLIHIHSPNPLAETSSLFLPPSKPVVVTYHSDIVRQRAFLPLYGPLLRAFLKRSRRVAVATTSQIHHSPFLRDLSRKCHVIPCGIDPSQYRKTPEIAAESDRIRQQHGRFALFVGRLVSYKGVHVLIEAMKKITEGKALIIGAGPLRQELEELSRELGVENRVHFLGYLSDQEVLAYYHACEMLILPSVTKAEAFGLVQLEAMACRKPSIVTRLDSGVTEVNEDGISGIFVDPGDPHSLAEAIQKIFTDDVLRLSMGEAAHKRFIRMFTQERMIEGYRELYRNAVSPTNVSS